MNTRPLSGCWPLITALLLCAPLAQAQAVVAQADPARERFKAEGTLQLMRSSEDGRFALGGQAQFIALKPSGSERYVLSSVSNAGALCGPLGNAIFANGFEP